MTKQYVLDLDKGIIHQIKKDVTTDIVEKIENKSNIIIHLMGKEDFLQISENFPYKRFLLRCINPIKFCKIELYKECVLGTMYIPYGIKDKIKNYSFAFYCVNHDIYLINEQEYLDEVIKNMLSNTYGKITVTGFLLTLFDALLNNDVIYLQKVEDQIFIIEDKVLDKPYDDFNETIVKYRRMLTSYHLYYEQIINIGDRMQSGIGIELPQEEITGWQIYSGRADRLHAHIETLREYLMQIRGLYQTQIDIEQNKVMKILTVVTTLFMPLSLIAAWYGMNFENMPELKWNYGYLLVFVISILIVIIEVLLFKRKKML